MIKSSVKRFGFVLIACIISTLPGCGDDSTSGPEVVNTNRVWVDAVTAFSTDDYVKVDVFFANLEPITGIEVPLQLDGTGFVIDSVATHSSRFADDAFFSGEFDNPRKQVVLASIEASPDAESVPAGQGLLASIYFSLLPESRGEIITIDSATIDPQSLSPKQLRYILDDDSLTEIVPEFIPGEISVLQ
jgi:hypothetical protein